MVDNENQFQCCSRPDGCHTAACYAAQGDRLRALALRVERMRKDVRNARRRTKRLLKRIDAAVGPEAHQ